MQPAWTAHSYYTVLLEHWGNCTQELVKKSKEIDSENVADWSQQEKKAGKEREIAPLKHAHIKFRRPIEWPGGVGSGQDM